MQPSEGEPGTSVSTNKLAAESGYDNPDSLALLLCHANEAMVVVEGMEMTALVDTVCQISSLTEGFYTEIGLRILPLRNLIGVCCIMRGQGKFQYHTKDA